MNVPVITLVGESHRRRVGLNLLTNAGLAAQSRQPKIGMCKLQHANEPAQLEQLRFGTSRRLRESILCNPRRFIQQLETLGKLSIHARLNILVLDRAADFAILRHVWGIV